MNKPYRTTFGELLRSIRFQVVTTVTLRGPAGLDRVLAALKGFFRSLERRSHRRVDRFWVIEQGQREGRWHAHTLLKANGALDLLDVEAACRPLGRYHIETVPGDGRIEHYLAKCVTDDYALYGFSPRVTIPLETDRNETE